MKSWILGLAAVISVLGCQENQDKEILLSEYTGNEASYPLNQASVYHINGSVTFKEKLDGSTHVVVALFGTEGNAEHPVHLHLGNITEPDAEILAKLNPVIGKSGNGETELSRLRDEGTITYKEILALNACIKVHLAASGADKDIILAAGNIGVAHVDIITGRSGIAVCKSE